MPPLPLYNDEKSSTPYTIASKHNPHRTQKGDESSTPEEKESIPRTRKALITRLVACIFILYFTIWPLAELAAWNVRRARPTNISDLQRIRGGNAEDWIWVEAENKVWGASAGSEAGMKGGKLVPLEAHIMSKCPDARDCLQKLVLPTMQRVSEKVNFTLSFIGT
jgi:hypothetical protein